MASFRSVLYIFALSFIVLSAEKLASEIKVLEQREKDQKIEGELNPKIEFEEILYDFGQITQDEGAKHRFVFKNTGNAELVIVNLKSSCGCTAAIASTGPYRPGESGFIEVSYDSRAKVGFVYKDIKVYSNDPNSPNSVAVEGIVMTDQHPLKGAQDVLFQGSCAQCHATPAKGKSGEKLYSAACALCHDFPQSVGKFALAGDRYALSNLSKRNLKNSIKEGIPNTSMPGFGEKLGGPLTKEQIDSLVDYLMSLKKEGG